MVIAPAKPYFVRIVDFKYVLSNLELQYLTKSDLGDAIAIQFPAGRVNLIPLVLI